MILVRQHVEFLWCCFGYGYDLDYQVSRVWHKGLVIELGYQVFRVWHKGLVMVLWFWTVVSSSLT